jgi:hypothetical protein
MRKTGVKKIAQKHHMQTIQCLVIIAVLQLSILVK